MSSNSQITLRNGKTLTGTTSADSTELTHEEQIVNMENDNENVDDQAQSRQSSSGPEIDSQRANDENFSHLQSEMSMLKGMMEKLLEQNEERNRQTDTNAATSSFAVRSSNMVTGVNRTHRNQRNYFHDEEDEEDYEDTPSNSTDTALLNAIQDLPRKLQKTNTKLLQTHVPNFRGSTDKYNEFEHLLLNHFRPIANKITEEDKIHSFQCLLRDEAIDFWQTITINPTTTLQEVLQLFRKEFAKEDMREVARYKWNEAKYDPTTQTFGDFLKNLKKIAKQAYGHEADKCIKMFLFGKLPIEIQQELTMANKEDSSPEEIKTYLLRKYQYQNVLQQPAATYQPFNQMSDNNPKRDFTRSDQSQPKPDIKRFDGKCFYCGKQGHRIQECRGRQRDEANGINKPDTIQPIKRQDEDEPKYNPKLVCQICGYTGNSARDCRKRIPKQTSTPHGQLTYQRTDEQENKEPRRELKQQQRPMNQMEIQDNDEDPSSEGEQDFQ